MIGRLFGFCAARDVDAAAGRQRLVRALAACEDHLAQGGFSRFVNGLNRLPRPVMAVGTLGLLAYAMVEPAGFSARMQGLAEMPEPLWWLIGVIISLFFAARELHYFRRRRVVLEPEPEIEIEPEIEPGREIEPEPLLPAPPLEEPDAAEPPPAPRPATPPPAPEAPAVAVRASDPDFNAALEEWRRLSA